MLTVKKVQKSFHRCSDGGGKAKWVDGRTGYYLESLSSREHLAVQIIFSEEMLMQNGKEVEAV